MTILGQRVGRPQVVAALFLLVFLAECCWIAARTPAGELERMYVREGVLQWRGVRMAGDGSHSPFTYLVAGAAPALSGAAPEAPLRGWLLWLIRAPFILAGILLGASHWYVARRLYGNAGGYVALILYVFSPLTVICAARAGPEIPAAWGFFGIVFTGIATSHTLYAPPQEIWSEARPRLVLLALSVGIGVASDFIVAVGLVLAAAFILYLVPGRRLAGLGMLGISTVAGLVTIFFGSYFFSPRALAAGLSEARLLGFAPEFYTSYSLLRLLHTFGNALYDSLDLTVLLLLAISLFAYAASRRSRYFGNSAPLLVIVVLVLLALARPVVLVAEFLVWLLPFIFVFIGGLSADLLEGRSGRVMRWVIAALLLANALTALRFLQAWPPQLVPRAGV